ncbi:MAG: acyl-CoA reductase [Bacteroidales bacterium]|nr:acyl-CoA reductase [Bacteroidales bacterium]
MKTEEKIIAFSELGKFFKQFDSLGSPRDPALEALNTVYADRFLNAIRQAEIMNPWFTREFILYSLYSLSSMLDEEALSKWIEKYNLTLTRGSSKNVGLIMAGNIPLVGFHDLLTVCMSGNKAIVKMSSKDKVLLPLVHEILMYLNPGFKDLISFPDQFQKNIEAIIATGSDNSSRYFDYYFGKYPHIIRKNRNSAAVLTGEEKPEEYKKLSDDIFLYFGMGCRNVSKLFLPKGFNIPAMLDNFETYSYLYNHNKYANNYDYYKAIYLVNSAEHLDTGYLIVKEDEGYASPVGVVYYEYYSSLDKLKHRLKIDENKIQCLVSKPGLLDNSTGFGETQRPGLTDYADGIDSFDFLINLYKK